MIFYQRELMLNKNVYIASHFHGVQRPRPDEKEILTTHCTRLHFRKILIFGITLQKNLNFR